MSSSTHLCEHHRRALPPDRPDPLPPLLLDQQRQRMQRVHRLVEPPTQPADDHELVLLLLAWARLLEEGEPRDVLAEVGRELVRVVLDADALRASSTPGPSARPRGAGRPAERASAAHLGLVVPPHVVPQRVQVAEHKVGQPRVLVGVGRVVPLAVVLPALAAHEAVVQAVGAAVGAEAEGRCRAGREAGESACGWTRRW